MPPREREPAGAVFREREPAAAEHDSREQCRNQADQVLAPAPRRRNEWRGERDGKRSDHGGDSFAQYGDDEPCAEEPTGKVRFARGERDAVPGERLSREHADLAECFVGMDEQAEAAEQGKHRRYPLGPAVELAACEVNEGEHRCHHDTACQARAVVGGEDQSEQLRGQRRDPVMERSVLQVRFARQIRHDPSPVIEHLVHDADADGVFGLPGIVTD